MSQQPPSGGAPAIEIHELTKRFGDFTAVDRLSFSVAPGETVALLGGNGAGKTTTISMLLGLLLPSGGSVRMLGCDMARHPHRVLHRINFSSPYVDLPRRLTVGQNLGFFARLYGIPDRRARLDELAHALDLEGIWNKRTGRLSAGQKTRVSLAKALINRPEVLLLDEPTASLDPDTADWLRSYLERYQAERHAAILLASHNMAEVERLCDRVVMLKAGRLVDEATPAALLRKYGRTNLEEVFLDIARDRRSEHLPAPPAEHSHHTEGGEL
ncbi:ABC transporter ATP-binding protein [Tistlia consotensis]|uniref:ABC transporter ATP-binding protein n=1 Tax=Tistlia consotensis TaxID=1321365 RepID=UPI002AC36777|nr:ABC transporter ATP-binding protein [Tistlia consotensis]